MGPRRRDPPHLQPPTRMRRTSSHTARHTAICSQNNTRTDHGQKEIEANGHCHSAHHRRAAAAVAAVGQPPVPLIVAASASCLGASKSVPTRTMTVPRGKWWHHAPLATRTAIGTRIAWIRSAVAISQSATSGDGSGRNGLAAKTMGLGLGPAAIDRTIVRSDCALWRPFLIFSLAAVLPVRLLSLVPPPPFRTPLNATQHTPDLNFRSHVDRIASLPAAAQGWSCAAAARSSQGEADRPAVRPLRLNPAVAVVALRCCCAGSRGAHRHLRLGERDGCGGAAAQVRHERGVGSVHGREPTAAVAARPAARTQPAGLHSLAPR